MKKIQKVKMAKQNDTENVTLQLLPSESDWIHAVSCVMPDHLADYYTYFLVSNGIIKAQRRCRFTKPSFIYI